MPSASVAEHDEYHYHYGAQLIVYASPLRIDQRSFGDSDVGLESSLSIDVHRFNGVIKSVQAVLDWPWGHAACAMSGLVIEEE